MADHGDGVKLTQLTRPGLMISFAVAVLAAGLFGVGIGTWLGAPSDHAIQATTSTIRVEVAIDERVVEDSTTLSGKVTLGKTISSLAFLPVGADRVVVTNQVALTGDRVVGGEAILELSGRPIIGLATDATFYRDIHVGDSGADVFALESALASLGPHDFDIDNSFTRYTARAIADLYKRLGYPPPGGTDNPYFKVDETISVGSKGGIITSIVAKGDSPEIGSVVLEVSTSPKVVTSRANLLQIESFAVDQDVFVNADNGKRYPAKVISIGQFQPQTDGSDKSAGIDITVALEDGSLDELANAAPVTVTTIVSAKPSPAIPVVALRQNDDGPLVFVKDSSKTGYHAVAVRVINQSEGWVSFSASENLQVGDILIVGP